MKQRAAEEIIHIQTLTLKRFFALGRSTVEFISFCVTRHLNKRGGGGGGGVTELSCRLKSDIL